MIEIEKFKQHLGIADMPKELDMLISFQNDSDFENYSSGFGLYEDNLDHWSAAPEFKKRLKVFAQANGSGSQYAFWEDEDGKKLSEMPVVVFGDEGGVHVVAKSMLELMHLLTFDAEISVYHDGASFYKDKEDYVATNDSSKYCSWLMEHFDLDSIEKPNTIITAAQNEYKSKFEAWIKLFIEL
jgi:hypothetical protein